MVDAVAHVIEGAVVEEITPGDVAAHILQDGGVRVLVDHISRGGDGGGARQVRGDHLYGVGSVKPESAIDLVVNMEIWDDQKAYDRLGLTNETQDILGVTVPSVTIPVRPGRNLAVILELAAMNNRQKKMGYNAAETLAANHDYAVDEGMM